MIREGYESIIDKDEEDSVGKLYLHSLLSCNDGYFIDRALEKLSNNGHEIEVINGYNRDDRFDHIVVKLNKEMPDEEGIIDIDTYGKVDYKLIEPLVYRFGISVEE